jgi:hypothetical protein
VGCRWADGPGGRQRWMVDMLLLVFGCRAWSVFVIVVIGLWGPGMSAGGRGCLRCSFLFADGGLRLLDLGGAAPPVRLLVAL